ncbi:hypothetical protein L1887_56894 [Cichorium endivia]|nr:hypothetical protein L1887_56894 [Cichorium endivia]
MGWAWSAAEILIQQDQQKAKEQGKPFDVGPRTEREAVLRAICESLPSKQMAYQLIDVYESRVRYLCGHVVHVPCLKREMEAFYALDSVEKRARVVNHVDPGWLAMFLSVLALGLRFYPCTPKAGWQPANHLFDGKTIYAWHSGRQDVPRARKLPQLHQHERHPGHPPPLPLHLGLGRQLRRRGRLGHHQHRPPPHRHHQCAGDGPPSPRRPRQAAETQRALVQEHFNTPLPGNYNDEDLMITPLPAPRPREEFTEMSYVLSNLEFGMVVKEDVDVRFRRELHTATNGGDRRLTCVEAQRLDVLYRGVLENAPSYFKVGSEIGRVTCIEVQRWLLQQAVFSKLLRIHRPQFVESQGVAHQLRAARTLHPRHAEEDPLALHRHRPPLGNAALARKDGSGMQEAAKPKRKRQMDVDTADDEGAATSGGGRRKNLLSLAQRVAQAAREDGSAAKARSAPAPVDEASKRQATMAAVRSMTDDGSRAAADRSLEVNGVTALKDDASLFRMNNITLPTSGPSPMAMSAQANTDDVAFPQMLSTMPFPSNLFNFDGSNEAAQRLVPPNGVDLIAQQPHHSAGRPVV